MKKIMLLCVFIFGCGDTLITQNIIVDENKEKDYSKELDWSNIDLNDDGIPENYVTSIKAQNGPDCVLFAITGMLEMQYKIDNKIIMDLDLSEQSILNCARRNQFGSEEVLNYYKKYGVMEEKYIRVNEWNSMCDVCERYFTSRAFGFMDLNNVPFYGIKNYSVYDTYNMNENSRKELLKSLIKNGPVEIEINSWNGLKNDKTGRVVCTGWAGWSGHAVTLVGYKDEGNVFILKNSHADGTLKELIFANSADCQVATKIFAINGTWSEYGKGQDFCFDNVDSDGDNIINAYDNCPYNANPNQENQDNDLLGDACDPCVDGVGVMNNPWDQCLRVNTDTEEVLSRPVLFN